MEIDIYECKISSAFNFGNVNDAIYNFDLCCGENNLDNTIKLYDFSLNVLNSLKPKADSDGISNFGFLLNCIINHLINANLSLDFNDKDLAILYNNLSMGIIDRIYYLNTELLRLYDNTFKRNFLAYLFPLPSAIIESKTFNNQKRKIVSPFYRLIDFEYNRLIMFNINDNNIQKNIQGLLKIINSKDYKKFRGEY